MSTWNPKANEILLEALEISDAADRIEFITSRCAGNEELRKTVESLLQEALKAESPLQRSPVHELEIQSDDTLTKMTGDAGEQHLPPRKFKSTAASIGTAAMIGPYKLLQRIGQGGMGEVWMAEQTVPIRRRVALKIIKQGLDCHQVIARFEAERQALALMDHQNIAKVLDAGTTDDGQPFFVMELVNGIPLTKFCDANKLDINERLALFISVCQAVQHAHQKGVVHRDLKPANVLVTMYDGKPVAKVIDFGLAKALEHQHLLTDKTLFTEFGQVVGTLQYMSPEQAEMNALDVDTRSDVYSLGVILYELLTGTTPIDKAALHNHAILKVLETIRQSDPPRPSLRLSNSGDAIAGISEQRRIDPKRLRDLLQGDLDWIVMKALDKDRVQRFESAAAFGDDVERFLAGDPVRARPPSTAYKLRKFVARNRGLVASVATIFILLVGAIAGTSSGLVWALNEKDRADLKSDELDKQATAALRDRNEANTQRKEADKAKNEAREMHYISNLQLAQSEWNHGDIVEAHKALETIPREFADWEANYLHSLITFNQETPKISGRSDGLNQFRFGPNVGELVMLSDEGFAIWDLQSNSIVSSVPWNLPVQTISANFSPDGKYVVVADRNYTFALWDVSTRKKTFESKLEIRFNSYELSSDGRFLIVTGKDIRVLAIAEDKWICTIPSDPDHAKKGWMYNVAYIPGTTQLVRMTNGSSPNKVIDVWDFEKCQRIFEFPESTLLGWGDPIACSTEMLAIAQQDGTIEIWNTSDWTLAKTLKDPSRPNVIGLSAQSDLLIASSEDHRINIWNLVSSEITSTLHDASYTQRLQISSDGQWFASGSDQIRVRRTAPIIENYLIANELVPVFAMDFAVSADSAQLTCSGGDHIHTYDLVTGKVVKDIDAPNIRHIAYRADTGTVVGAENGEKELRILNCDTREYVPLETSKDVSGLGFSPDASEYVGIDSNERIVIYQTDTGKLVRSIPTNITHAYPFAISPDGKHLAVSGSVDNENDESDLVLRLWDLDTTTLKWESVLPLDSEPSCLKFSPDGTELWSGNPMGKLICRKVESGDIVRELKGHLAKVSEVSFSPNGKRIVSCDFDTVRIWNRETGRQLLKLDKSDASTQFLGQLTGVQFTPDSNRLLASQGTIVHVWSALRSLPPESQERDIDPSRSASEGEVE